MFMNIISDSTHLTFCDPFLHSFSNCLAIWKSLAQAHLKRYFYTSSSNFNWSFDESGYVKVILNLRATCVIS